MPRNAPIDYGTAESMPHTTSNYHSDFGRSFVTITCPFCHGACRAYVWSLNGGGKRCSCGAMHTGRGLTYRNRPAVSEEAAMHPKNETGFKSLDRLAADARVERITLDSDGLWCDLAPGYNFDGCSGFRADSAKRLLLDATRIEEGEPC